MLGILHFSVFVKYILGNIGVHCENITEKSLSRYILDISLFL